jgi:predicted ATPase with chaperone activity
MLAAEDIPASISVPPPFASPETLSGLGLKTSLVTDLFLKHALAAGNNTLGEISQSLKIAIPLSEAVFHLLKAQQLIEVRGMFGEDYSFTLSAPGKKIALERMAVSGYVGPVPVPLGHYELAVRSQVGRTRVNQEVISRAFKDLALAPDLVGQLGPALVSRDSMFLYGPSGTGKSSLAERLLRVFDDVIAIPWAVETEGNIISVFDASFHRVVGLSPPDQDPRWQLCARPSIVVGGELVPSMLELQRNPETGAYVAPLHMKANNGVFVIDDFGRQLISPRELLNRWIVPLDRRIDYLSTAAGMKFPIPFEVFVVFSSNMEPTELADEAFLRRIRNKIFIGAVEPWVFDEIVSRREELAEWKVEPGAKDYLRKACMERGGDLRPCYPRDIFKIIESVADFEEREPMLSKADIDRAAKTYFMGKPAGIRGGAG